MQLPSGLFCFYLKGQHFRLEGFYLIYQAITLVHQGNILFPDGSDTCLTYVCHLNLQQGMKFPTNYNFSGFAVFTFNADDSC